MTCAQASLTSSPVRKFVIMHDMLYYVHTAVLLENFTVFYSKGDTLVDDKVVADFCQNWYFFDRRAIVSHSQNIYYAGYHIMFNSVYL